MHEAFIKAASRLSKEALQELHRKLTRQARYAACGSILFGTLSSLLAYLHYKNTLVAGLILGINMGIMGVALSAFADNSQSRRWLSKLRRFWDLFPFILPRKTREGVYEAAFNDLLYDYVLAKR